MRAPFIISSSAHAVILLAAVVGLPSISAYDIEEPPPIPVEILTVDEFTKLTAKAPDPEPAPEPAPEPEPEPVVEKAPAPEPKPEAAPEPEKVAALEPEPEPLPLPEPEPEPETVVEPLPLPEPEPVPEPVVETPPDPEPVAAPEPEVEQAAKPEPVAEPPEEVVAPPRRKPKPPPVTRTVQREPEKQEPKFDADRISALLNKLPDEAGGTPRQQSANAASADQERNLGGLDTLLTQSEIAYLRQQVQRCWNPPVGVAGAETLAVKIQLDLRRDGGLASAPVVMNSGSGGFQVAAEAAVRAVTQCQPYELPGEKYDAWREIIFTFDPRFMLGG